MDTKMATLADAALLGSAPAISYETNPLVRWMFEDDLSESRLRGLFTSLVDFGIRNGLVFHTSDRDGASIWVPPIAESWENLDVTGETSEWSGGRRDNALAVLAEARPAQPHFYLDAVGVAPSQRRRGIASCLLAPVLAKCDAEGLGAYLENSDPANAIFYGRHRFKEIAPPPTPRGAPVVRSMWRQAQKIN